MWHRLGSIVNAVGFGHALLALILVVCSVTLYGNGQILEALRQPESPPVSTTYIDVDGQSHTVPSPMLEDPVENARVHKLFLKAAFCQFPPMTNPAWFNPTTDCPR